MNKWIKKIYCDLSIPDKDSKKKLQEVDEYLKLRSTLVPYKLSLAGKMFHTHISDIFLLSVLKRQHSLSVPSLAELPFTNIKRLFFWMLRTIPANFEDMDSKEARIFGEVSKLTSSADFIKAVRASQIDQV
jgi:hypothetical protein